MIVLTKMRSIITIALALIAVGLFSPVTWAETSSKISTEQVCLSTCIKLADIALAELPQSAQDKTLEQERLRVVALNWSATEMLLTLGITPVGVPTIDGYRKWQTNSPPLPEYLPQTKQKVIELGTRQEPSLARIAALKPDLIIGYDFRHQRLLPSLTQIAPTLLYQQFPKAQQDEFRYFTQAQRVFLAIGKAVGREQRAQQQLAQMQQTLDRLKQELAAQGFANYPVSYGKFVGMGYGLRMFTQQSLAGSVAQAIGLNYQWQQGLPSKDFTHLQLEQLYLIDQQHLLIAENQIDAERMQASPVWAKLPFVAQQTHSTVPPLWSFGGPESIKKMAQAFRDALIGWQQTQQVLHVQAGKDAQ